MVINVIRQRYREIALRKVNGATGRQVALLFGKKYLYILGASFVIAIPLVYYIIDDYTKDFAVKAPIGAGIFVTGFILTLLVSLGTLLWQVRKAVRINPALIMKVNKVRYYWKIKTSFLPSSVTFLTKSL